MPSRNLDLHGMVPDSSSVALILLDVINDLEWEGGDRLLEHAVPMAVRLADLKPKHSGFFSTSLDVLLEYLGARTLLLTGVAGNICVLFTGNDAYMRDFFLAVSADCMASNDPRVNAFALRQMATILDADTTPSVDLDLEALKQHRRTGALG